MSFLPAKYINDQSNFLAPNPYVPQSFGDVNPDFATYDRFKEEQQQQQEYDTNEEEDAGFFSELGTGLVAGVEGFARSGIGALDMLLMDALPESWEERTFDRPDSMFGGLVEGITSFSLGMIPGLGIAGALGKGAKILGASDKLLKTTKAITAGAAADFIAFDGHEGRLSDFLVEHDITNNEITQYLSSNEDDSEFEGRMKNVLEGGAIGGIASVFLKGLKTLKRGKKLDGSTAAEELYNESIRDLEKEAIDAGLLTESGLKLSAKVKELLPEARLRVRSRTGETPLDDLTPANVKEVDPTNPLPRAPDCD